MRVLCISCCLLFSNCALAQSNASSGADLINSSVADITLHNVAYYGKEKIALKEFKGRRLILDFFSLGCSACFASFPKLKKLGSLYRDSLQIVLIGQDNKTTGELLRKSYNKYQKTFGLNFPVAYDSALFAQFKIKSVPFVIWVDRDGIIKHVTSSPELNDENIERFLDGKEIFSTTKGTPNKPSITFNPNKPLFVNNNGGIDTSFLQRSLFAKWQPGYPMYSNVSFEMCRKYNDIPEQLIITAPLTQLYRVAYFGQLFDWQYYDTTYYGKYCYSPIIEVADTSLFVVNLNTGTGYFIYSQILPRERRTCDNMQEVMKADLKNCYGYEVTVEWRMMPCLHLIATNKAKKTLRTAGGKSRMIESYAGLEYVNIPIAAMVSKIVYDCYLVSKDMPIIDKTGITGNIDIKLDAAMTDLNNVREGLLKNGLDLVKGEMEMKVIVIRDMK